VEIQQIKTIGRKNNVWTMGRISKERNSRGERSLE
jgi:hypothetical protein